MSWLAFFCCFFAWFGIAPLMTVIREELHLTDSQVGWCIIASVSMTAIARVLIGWLCDRIGPRLAYSWLLLVGGVLAIAIAFSYDFKSFLIFRLLLGGIGASFVVTQYHTSMMFAPNVVGTANATSAGWGNLGGGVSQFAMPLMFSMFIGVFGFSAAVGWRASMMVAGLLCMLVAVGYFFFTQDTAEGNFRDLRLKGKIARTEDANAAFWRTCRDPRVWTLAMVYGACFGVELTFHNVAAIYFSDSFGLGLVAAGLAASLFGLMNLFGRTLGGLAGDWLGSAWGLRGRVTWLFVVLLCEGIALMLFSQMRTLPFAIGTLVIFALFVEMASGATYSVVPFLNRDSLGATAGIVGAGGNVGAVLAGFLFGGLMEWSTAFLLLGAAVVCCSLLTLSIRFSADSERDARRELKWVAWQQHQEQQQARPSLESG